VLTTTQLDHLLPRCITPCEGAWELGMTLTDHCMRERVNIQLKAAAEVRRKMLGAQETLPELRANIIRLKNGGPVKILDYASPRLVQKHDGVELSLYEEEADGMWLPHRQVALVELTGKPILCAFSGSTCLILGFSDSCIGTIVEAFQNRGVEPVGITIHAFFGRPRMPGDYYAHIEQACQQMGVKAQCMLRLEKDARHGYIDHPTLHDQNLGMIMRLS